MLVDCEQEDIESVVVLAFLYMFVSLTLSVGTILMEPVPAESRERTKISVEVRYHLPPSSTTLLRPTKQRTTYQYHSPYSPGVVQAGTEKSPKWTKIPNLKKKKKVNGESRKEREKREKHELGVVEPVRRLVLLESDL